MSLPESIKKKHFLIVDDYESQRVLIIDTLRQLGVTKISSASSGNEAFNVLQNLESSDPIKFIITDLVMENGDGVELTKRVRSLGKKIPIVMITSKSDVSYVLETIKAGVSGYIIKPWKNDEFGRRIVEADKKFP